MNEDLSKRYRDTVAVFTKFSQMKPLPDGAALRFPQTVDWAKRLERFTEVWQKSCPYFTFEVTGNEDNESVWLRITGPEGTLSFVEGANKMLTSNLNPAPSKRRWLQWKFARLTNPIRMLPDFLIFGAKKCGTTSLYAHLIQHPYVASALRKEVYFFDGYYRFGPSWYRAFFPTKLARLYARRVLRQDLLTGEASPEYILDRDAPARVYETIPNVKLIAILRNPVDKAYSYYQHQLRVGFETLPFDQAVDRELAHLQEDPSYFDLRHSYLTGGMYADQLQRWLKYFPQEQFLLLGNEELSSNPAETFDRVISFLNLPAFEPKNFKKLNAFPYPDMSAEMRKRLVRYFEPHNQRLYEILGNRFEWDR